MRTRWTLFLAVASLAIAAVIVSGCGDDDDDSGSEGGGKEVTIGWTPPDITGVFKTATDFFEQSAEGANAAGFDVEIVSRSPRPTRPSPTSSRLSRTSSASRST